ncbi:MAG: hypothetical protein J6S56_05315 [Bacteroidales bacterium]|nr:hypothetical protein [Bacteroidales bacterium]
MNLWKIYNPDIPPFIQLLAAAPAMARLQHVGMNCGCEYTSFPMFEGLDCSSRYDHSVGCGLIVWHFTRDVRQAVAALLHDISTPVFAHVVDFLNGDNLRQESTEDATEKVIANSPELMAELLRMGLLLEEVSDYHLYPIADNDTPRLSADRLEYTLGNVLNYRLAPWATIQAWYDHLVVGKNEVGEDELMFDDLAIAEAFALAALHMSRVYVSDEDRYAMQMLAELLRKHINRGVISRSDLYLTEPEIISKLEADASADNDWRVFRAMRHMHKGPHPEKSRVIAAKKRYINPMVRDKGRVADLSPVVHEDMQRFLENSFEEEMWGE